MVEENSLQAIHGYPTSSSSNSYISGTVLNTYAFLLQVKKLNPAFQDNGGCTGQSHQPDSRDYEVFDLTRQELTAVERLLEDARALSHQSGRSLIHS